ncbi:hypothetical protein BH11ACT2_BH11ACT2_00910 [soil metagenome]
MHSVVRGAVVGFYYSPFFNPGAVSGYGGVALCCVVLHVAFLLRALGVRTLGNVPGRRRAT